MRPYVLFSFVIHCVLLLILMWGGAQVQGDIWEEAMQIVSEEDLKTLDLPSLSVAQNKPSEKQVPKPPVKETVKPPEKQVPKPPEKEPVKPPEKQVPKPLEKEPVKPPEKQVPKPPEKEPVKPPEKQVPKPPEKEPVKPPEKQVPKPPEKEPVKPPEKQVPKPPQKEPVKPPEKQVPKPPQKDPVKPSEKQVPKPSEKQAAMTTTSKTKDQSVASAAKNTQSKKVQPVQESQAKGKKVDSESQKRGGQKSLVNLDVIYKQLSGCWNVPLYVKDVENIRVTLSVTLNKDRSLASYELLDPKDIGDPSVRVVVKAAIAALENPKCQYLFFPEGEYDSWKNLVLVFDPGTMAGGAGSMEG